MYITKHYETITLTFLWHLIYFFLLIINTACYCLDGICLHLQLVGFKCWHWKCQEEEVARHVKCFLYKNKRLHLFLRTQMRKIWHVVWKFLIISGLWNWDKWIPRFAGKLESPRAQSNETDVSLGTPPKITTWPPHPCTSTHAYTHAHTCTWKRRNWRTVSYLCVFFFHYHSWWSRSLIASFHNVTSINICWVLSLGQKFCWLLELQQWGK